MKRASLYSPEHQVLVTLLRDLRLDANLSQADVAVAIDRPQTYISAVEIGQRGLDLLQVRELSELYGVDLPRFASLFEERVGKTSNRPARRKRADAITGRNKMAQPDRKKRSAELKPATRR